MSKRIEGYQYQDTQEMDIKDIAKKIRRDIRKQYPVAIFSVRIERFSGGQSINVTIKKAPFVVTNPAYDFNASYNPQTPRYTTEAKLMLDIIEQIVSNYNYDNSDSQSDYFEKKFYSHT